jgi:hypothetical protein
VAAATREMDKLTWRRIIIQLTGRCQHRTTGTGPGTSEPHYAYVNEGVHALDEWFSVKKVENHEHILTIYFLYYNFGRVHQTLSVMTAMGAGLANHVWSIEEMVILLERKLILKDSIAQHEG